MKPSTRSKALLCSLPWLVLLLGGAAPASEPVPAARPVGARPPVVLELFTSEGCSSCPPADQLLVKLTETEDGAESGKDSPAPIIALEWHVDYWNYVGWTDPFSSASHTERQHRYADALSRGRSYTPQLVVDGRYECLGSSEARTRSLIAQAAQGQKLRVLLDRAPEPGHLDRMVIQVPDAKEAAGAEVSLAITETGVTTAVQRGENAGKSLRHGPVVRSFRRLAQLGPAPLRLTADLSLAASWKRQNLRAVVLVHAPGTGAVLGAAQLTLGPS